MATFAQTYTNQGLTQLAATISSLYTVTRMAAGSGSVGTPATATALGSQQISSVTLGAATILSPGQFVIQATINSGNYSGAPFTLTELGLFGTSPGVAGGAEQLTMYVSVTGGPLVENSSTNPIQIIYLVFNIAVSNSSNVSVTVGSGVYALESDFVTHLADPAAHPQAFINPFNLGGSSKQGLVLASPSTGVNVLSQVGANAWAWLPGLLAIIANTTLYVSTTGNDSTALHNDPAQR
jgi:hypothetical protein